MNPAPPPRHTPRSSWWVRLPVALLGAGLALGAHLDILPFTLVAGALSEDGSLSPAFLELLGRDQGTLGVLLLLTALAAPLLVAGGGRVTRYVHAAPRPGLIGVLAVVAFALALTVQQVVLEGIPHVTDETSYAFQAKIFAAGKLTAPLPPCYELFWQHNVIMTEAGTWFSKYPPGQALWLTPGEWLHCPGLPMPLAHGLCVVFLWMLARRLVNEEASVWIAALWAISPIALLLGASRMSHTTTVMWILAGLVFLVRGIRPYRVHGYGKLLLGAGLCLGAAAITRPPDLFIVAVIGVVALISAERLYLVVAVRRCPWVVAGFAFPIAIHLAWNQAVFGSVFATGYNLGSNPSLTPIIDDTLGFSPLFTVGDATRQALYTVRLFNRSLLGWPSSLLVVVFSVFAVQRGRVTALAGAGAVIVAFFYYFFPYYAHEYEARYYLALTPLALVLVVLGLDGLAHLVRRYAGDACASTALAILVASGCLHMAIFYWPAVLLPRYGSGYEEASPIVETLAAAAGIENAVILLAGGPNQEYRYSSGFIWNDPRLQRSRIYARDRDDAASCIRDHFPGRALWRFVPGDPDWTGGRFEQAASRP